MIVKLLPDQVATYWEYIKYGTSQALPPIAEDSEDMMNNILTGLLNGRLKCWLSIKKTEDGKRFCDGLVVTAIISDPYMQTKSLLIYALYSSNNSISDWKDAFKSLVKYAIACDCKYINAYTQNEKLLSMIEKLGGDMYTYISFPLVKFLPKGGG
jgi:protoheme ferro-lyase